MTNQPRAPYAVRPATLAALFLFVALGTVARAQDLVASSTPLMATPATAPSALAAESSAKVAVPPDRLAQEVFLRSAPISKVRGVKVGVTGTQRAALSSGDVTHDASIQTIDESQQIFQSSKGTELNFRDYWGYNVAAYRLGVMLGLDNIPVSVARRFNSRDGAFTWWVDDVLMDERARAKDGVTPPDPAAWSAQVHVMRVFDELIANTDRNQGNILIDRGWKLWLIDHSRAFRTQETLRAPMLVRRCDRELLTRMKALTRAAVDRELGDYLTGPERKALMARRDALVSVIESRGTRALYDGSTRP